jgi:hypothetical protein
MTCLQVIEMDCNGQLLREYGGTRGQAPGQLNWPCYVTVDAAIGWMLIVERDNKRIAVLNRELQLERYLLSSKDHGSMYVDVPKLCFVGQSGQLAVGASKHIHLFQLRKPITAAATHSLIM